MLYGAWSLIGLAMAMTLYEPVFSEVTRRFPDCYRQAITALTLVGGFASTLSFPASAALIDGLGWRGALAAIAALLAFGVAPLHAWALSANIASGAPAGRPLNGHPRPGDTRRDEPFIVHARSGATLHEAAAALPFWLLTAAFTCHAFVAAALWAHVMPAFAAKGLADAEAIAVVVWFGPAQVAGRLAFLAAGARLSPHRLGSIVLFMLPLSLAVFAVANSTAALIAFALLFGVSNGLTTIVRGHIVPAFYGTRQIGRISAAMSAAALLSRAAAPLGAAALLLALHGYRNLGFALVAIGAVAAVSFWAAGWPSGRPKPGSR